jgi:hypothetical protein
MRAYADENDHIYLDYYSALVDEQGGMQARFTSDGVHVTPAGYAVMEELVEAAIDEALSRPRSRPGNVSFAPIRGCAPSAGPRKSGGCD